MELDSATMAVSLIGFELGSGHREQYYTVEELYYEAEIRNVARQQALIFMYLIEERYLGCVLSAVLPAISLQ
jgi:hypothetical protein